MKFIASLLPMLLPAVGAAVAVDYVLAGPQGRAGWIGFLLGLAGVAICGVLTLRWVYRRDRERGRVKRRIRALE